MIWLVAVIALFTELAKVIQCEDLLPVGKEMGVHDRPVHLMTVKLDPIRTRGDADERLPARLNNTPSPGHRDQVAPGVQGITIPDKYMKSLLRSIIPSKSNYYIFQHILDRID